MPHNITLKPKYNHSKLTASAPSLVPNHGNTSASLARYYNFPTQHSTAPTIAVISLGGTYLTSDLTHYWGTILGLSPSQFPTVTYVQTGGATNAPNQKITSSNEGESIENTLDIQMIGGSCPKSHIIVYFGPNTNAGFYGAIHSAILGPAKIISISWGAPEVEWGSATIAQFNALLQTAIAAKKIVCVASGDNGANDGVAGALPNVDFPASSPSVVACGGTSITNPTAETTWSWNKKYHWGTGGGLSQYVKRPAYQLPIVPRVTTTNPKINALNANRALPDIALNADPLSGMTIYFNNNLYINAIGGTSAVAPMMSGFFGLCNLTFNNGANEKLYNIYANTAKRAICFKDIKTGTNDNIATANVYNATGGFDMCTGMGSINGVNLYNALSI